MIHLLSFLLGIILMTLCKVHGYSNHKSFVIVTIASVIWGVLAGSINKEK